MLEVLRLLSLREAALFRAHALQLLLPAPPQLSLRRVLGRVLRVQRIPVGLLRQQLLHEGLNLTQSLRQLRTLPTQSADFGVRRLLKLLAVVRQRLRFACVILFPKESALQLVQGNFFVAHLDLGVVVQFLPFAFAIFLGLGFGAFFTLVLAAFGRFPLLGVLTLIGLVRLLCLAAQLRPVFIDGQNRSERFCCTVNRKGASSAWSAGVLGRHVILPWLVSKSKAEWRQRILPFSLSSCCAAICPSPISTLRWA